MPYADREKQRQAQARYYQEGKARLNAIRTQKRNLWRRHIQDIKNSTPCADCGIQYPHYVMDFDHLPGFEKKFCISNEMHSIGSFKVLTDEIEKCEVVCGNCHRHRTFMRKTLPL